MPRYRLFGDTVQFAALLNSTGECEFDRNSLYNASNLILYLAMKIHVSMETKILLDSVSGYFLEPRGLIVVDVSIDYFFFLL